MELRLPVAEEGMTKERVLKPGDLISVTVKLDQGFVYLKSMKMASVYEPQDKRRNVARLDHGDIGIILHAAPNVGEVFALFPGPALGWIWRSNVDVEGDDAC